MLFCPLQGVGVRIIADNGDDPGITDFSFIYGVQNGLQVRAAAGYQYCYL